MDLELLNSLTAGHLAGGAALLFVTLASIIQVSPIKINPWTKLAKAVGRAINGEVLDKVDNLERKVSRIQDEADERDAKEARTRILRFGDECLHNVKHSKEHFDQIMRDIKAYEIYCEDHPHFENNQAVHTIQLINEIYHKRLIEHSFL